ncbi:KAP family P-loop NTPase fold protein [Acidovorax soli]|uniref:KAP family P-loop domain-containing protein n=1 Tax=Acidovorax soli TaxID=592050 RepID=A0A1H4EXZ6_9BURK|nr:P-loop NTPase fold protein [Acidovorax soli]SEA89829.1 KAP family P-loop domain-containing protein [Acidovorax soli]
MNQPTLPIFKRPTTDDIPTRRFEGDLYAREELANRLTQMLARMPDGAVLSIDSPWGEGKSWFGRRWQATLSDQEFRTAYIDCFARDHIEDPFTMLASEFIALAKQGKPEAQVKLLEAGKKIGASLLPAAAKFAANAAGHWLIGNAELGDDIAKSAEAIGEKGADKLERLVAKSIEDYEAGKKTVDGFKKALRELAAESDKPIVIFVDELDRCRPDFAVRTIERIKHFFDVPGIIFVLLINRKQLTAAVKGLYGQEVEADAYLGKFINLSLSLPKHASGEFHSPDDNRKHCEETLVRYGFARNNGTQEFSQVMGVLGTQFKLSLRDIERAVILFSFGQPINSSAVYAPWPIALKLAHPDLFAKLVLNDREAHSEAYRLAASVREKSPENMRPAIQLLEEMHNCGSQGFARELPEEQAQMLSGMTRVHGVKRFFAWLFERADLTVSQ